MFMFLKYWGGRTLLASVIKFYVNITVFAFVLFIIQFFEVLNMGLDTKNLPSGVNEKQRRKPACASAQSDQRLCYSLIGKYHI